MSPEEPDDQFADLLAEYENAMVHGGPTPTSVRPPPEVKARIEEALGCVQMLQQLWPAAPGETQARDDRRGDRYRLLRLHATGGMGQVWLAEDLELGRQVALKEVRADRSADPALGRRFLQEARVTGRLQHPGVVPVYELEPGRDGEPPYYAMRLVRGRTLAEAAADYHRKRGEGLAGPLDLHTLLSAFVSVCNTVAYAHSQGILHRDLKTANVVLGDFGEVVLLDWGFAKGVDDAGDAPAAELPLDDNPQHTLAGQVVGTPAYMAPEQAAGQRDRIDVRTDVFGLGAILYEILTGRPPFSGTDTRELIRQAREGEPPPPEQICPGIAPALAAICKKALAREPAARYPAAAPVAREVERWLADEPTEVYRESLGERLRRWGRRHKPLMTALTALLATLLVMLFIGLLLHEREQADRAAMNAAARDRLETHLYFERIALAERELAAHNLARATQLLAECPPDRRGWEWDCLQRLCHTDGMVLRGHAAPVSAAVFCLDGQRIVSAAHDRTIRIWDAATGNPLQAIPGHSDIIHCLAASPDGRRFATGSWDRSVKIWDAASGQELRTLAGHPGIVIRVAFGPDGRWLAAVSNHAVTLWDLEKGEQLRVIENPSTEIYGLAISPDGRQLATGDGNYLIKLYDVATGAEVRVLRGHQAHPKHLAFSPDGRRLAAGDGDTLQGGPGAVKIWDLKTGTAIFTLQGHTYPVFSIAFSPDGQRVFSGSQDNSIKVWDAIRGMEALTLRGHSDVVRSLTFSPDGRRLLSASSDRTVRVWDATPWQEGQTPGERRVLRGHEEQVIGVGVESDGRRIPSLSYDKVVKLWDPETGQLQTSEKADRRHGHFHSFAVGPKALALGTSSGAVVLADPATGREIGVCLGFGGGPVKGLAFSPDGEQLAAAEFRNTVKVWNVATRQPIHVLKGHSEAVVAVAYGGDWLASASYDQTAKLWDARTGQERFTLEGHTSRLTAIAIRPDGARVATAANDGTIKLWDTATGKELKQLHDHTAAVGALAFSPDGSRLASASDDWTVKLWDVSKGEWVRTYRGHAGPVRALAFTPDGRRLVTGGQDRAVRIWDLP